jgi:ribosomal protein S27E
MRSAEREVPCFVEREFRAFLECGVLSRGFLRVHCASCGMDRVVGFSCKKRGWCPSCGGRRMAETAAHLVDHVLPHVPIRQWVLSVRHGLRYRMAYDADLLSRVMRIF